MVPHKATPHFLTFAAVFVALAVPSLAFGRAMVGVTLGLAFLAILFAVPIKQIVSEMTGRMSRPFVLLLGVVAVASAVNIPFSLRIGLSFEAWGRTWLLLGLISFVCFSLKDRLELIFKVMAVAFLCVVALNLYQLHVDHKLNKLLLNGLLLLLPIVVYQSVKDRTPLWVGVGVASVVLYILAVLDSQSKVSLLGMAIMMSAGVALFSLSRFSKKQAILIAVAVVAVLVATLAWWLPGQLYSSSAENMSMTPVPVWLIDFHRQLIWTFGFELFQESPWVGFGLNASNYHPLANQPVTEYFAGRFGSLSGFENIKALPSHPHNWLVEMLIDGGLIATLPVVMLVTYVVVASVRRYLTTQSACLLIFIMVQLTYWGTGLFNFSFWSTWWQATYFLASFLMLSGYVRSQED
ncbi:O-antigen ligase family protein [Terasakiella pusilla]|uniref:O-antigen ligase family protein n=1 Tax=Terasakiella pusilla TaxID=64973 RepID=UPI003AA8668C